MSNAENEVFTRFQLAGYLSICIADTIEIAREGFTDPVWSVTAVEQVMKVLATVIVYAAHEEVAE